MARKLMKTAGSSSKLGTAAPLTASKPTRPGHSPAAEEIWAEMEAIIRRLEMLPPGDRQQIQARFHALPKQEKERWWSAILAGIPMNVLVEILGELNAFVGIGWYTGGGEIGQAVVSAIEDRFIPKPRNTVRDEQIVQLHDEKALTFGQIGKKLNMSRDAVEKAYHRRKKRQT